VRSIDKRLQHLSNQFKIWRSKWLKESFQRFTHKMKSNHRLETSQTRKISLQNRFKTLSCRLKLQKKMQSLHMLLLKFKDDSGKWRMLILGFKLISHGKCKMNHMSHFTKEMIRKKKKKRLIFLELSNLTIWKWVKT